MKSRKELRALARQDLGGQIFSNNWMLGLVACLIVSAITSAASSFFAIGTVIISGPFAYGAAKTFLDRARGEEKYKIETVFKGFSDDFGGTLLIGLMSGIFVFLWTLLLIIPGIVKAYAYSMAYYVKIDNPTYSWKQCITASRRLMDGYKMDLFLLDLSFIGWVFVGMLCLGVGVLWVFPYQEAAHAQFYKALVEDQPRPVV